MPDSLPPNGGPSPYDGWDLKGLLSDENVWVSAGMRPVAATLAALCSAPMRAELAGEATARAMFRQIMAAREDGSALSGGETGDAPTLVLQAPGAADGPHLLPPPRRSYRRPARRRRWQAKALVGAVAAAAAVVIAGVALAGPFSGAGGGQLGRSSDVTSATTRPTGTGPGPNGLVEGNATKEAARHPTPGASGSQQSAGGSGVESDPSALCRQYWAFLSPPKSSGDSKAKNHNLQQLSQLAGGLGNVNQYCMTYPPGPGGSSAPEVNPGGPDFQAPGGAQGSAGMNPPAQHGGDGTGNGSGTGGNGTGGNGAAKGGNSSGAGGLQ